MMNVQCLDCESTYKIDDNKVPPEGKKVKCPKCENLLSVKSPVVDISDQKDVDNQKSFCPFCGEQNPVLNHICEHCGEALVSHVSTQPLEQASIPKVKQLGDGHFIFSCAYAEVWEIARTAMKTCGVRIKKADVEKGSMTGKCKLGINPFGITVTSIFNSAENNSTVLKISASLTDAFDTTGACKKKVAQISANISALIDTGGQHLPVPVPVPKQIKNPPAVLEEASTVESKTKKCPFCAEEILSDAIKCKHCHSEIQKNVPITPEILTSASGSANTGQNQANDTPIHIELKKFNDHDHVYCMECGYEGLMGIVPGTKKVPLLVSWPVIIILLFTGIGFIGGVVLGFLRAQYTKYVYSCPSCKQHIGPC